MPTERGRLFVPIQIGPWNLSSRIVMGPISSNLADANNVLSSEAEEYYGRRGGIPGTLLIGEATFISAAAGGTTESRSGIWTSAQVDSWKRIVNRVHAAGSYILLQLWALGRTADPEIKKQQGTGDVVSSSAVAEVAGGHTPRPMTEIEIQTYIRDYAQAARLAVQEAGFDGIELHGGNGSLIDQFTQDVVNQREDQWGGSIENRSRFAVEVTRAVCEAVGHQRVGFRISPFSTYAGMGMRDAIPQFSHLLQELKMLDIAYIHLVESRIAGRVDVPASASLEPFLDLWGTTKPVILAGGYSPEAAKQALDEEYREKDVAIAFGRAFVIDPDFVRNAKAALLGS